MFVDFNALFRTLPHGRVFAISLWIQFILATPVVLWGGWPFFVRAWQSVINRSPNMFTLIGLGVGVAYFYSLIAKIAPGAFPDSFKEHGIVPVYFEAAAVITTLVLLGQVLELKARSRTGAAIRALLDLARHYGFQPRACKPYRAKTKGKVERPFRYIQEDFFLGGAFRNLDDLNAQLRRDRSGAFPHREEQSHRYSPVASGQLRHYRVVLRRARLVRRMIELFAVALCGDSLADNAGVADLAAMQHEGLKRHDLFTAARLAESSILHELSVDADLGATSDDWPAVTIIVLALADRPSLDRLG